MSMFVIDLAGPEGTYASDILREHIRHDDEYPDLGPADYMVSVYFGSLVVTTRDHRDDWKPLMDFVRWLGEMKPSTGEPQGIVRQIRKLRGGMTELHDHAALELATAMQGTWGRRC
ncbi:hypothetical protein MX572_02070 [Rhodococcus pyridinivorans]|uniref:hypothetical protein n=1 Tax=Rhodococcus pyridinivorans TaxID=103816 RepID=UPI0020C72B5B|nr:hypothetical protein [Rhodococcus pyridinivorans]UTM37639.1 hypothetical protein MX572_02070 [Rhodococcus pyridinivorans]